MTEIRLPRLLDEEMRERARLHPAAARARIRLNALSTAEVTLDEEDAPLRVRDMAELYGPQGSLGIFRVSALQAAGGGLRLAEMEHGLCTLEDDVTPPGTVLQGAIGDVVATLLQWQSRPIWKLGAVESGVVLAETEADGANLLETLLAVLAIDESLMIETDQRALPWVLHLKKMPAEGGCECRLNRNLDGVTVALDGSELCTRVTAVLPDGASVTRDGDTVGTWGVVHRAVTLDENQNPETEIRKYLEEHKNPGVSVELEAVALAALTGETLDRFSLGGLCRVALPEWNTVISERVIAMAYDDLFGEPGKVKLTLCSQTLDAAALLARLRAEQRRSGRQMFRFIRETKNGVEILAEEILLRATKTEVAELNGVLTDKISEVSVELDAANAQLRLKANQEYVDQQFSATELLLDGANARIEANALRIDEVNDQISSANLAIDGANARIDAEAKRIDEANQQISSANLAIDGANARIDAEAKRIDEANGEISSAKLAIDGANARIDAEAKRIDEANAQISSANLAIDGANARIDAEAKRIDEANELISSANLAIDGANARIDAEAKRIDEANGEISSAKLAIDGANAAITAEVKRASDAEGELTGKLEITTEAITAEVTRATGEEEKLAGRIKITEDSITEQTGKIDAQGKLIEGAQREIDGINAKITDFATHTEVTDLGKTVNTVSETLDAVKGEVETKVSQETFDALGERVGTAETKITQNADAIELRATKKELDEVSASLKVESDKITSVVGDVNDINGTLGVWDTWISGIETNVISQRDAIQGVIKDVDTHNTLIYQNRDAIALCATKEGMAAAIKVEADRITSVVGDVNGISRDVYGYEDEEGVHHGGVIEGIWNAQTEITQTKEAITLKANADTVNALTGRVEKAESQIEINANGITQTVKKGELISQINQSAEEVKISASKVNLVGYVTAQKLETEYLTAEQIEATYVTADEISSFVTGEIDLERVNADSGSIMSLYCDTLTVNSWNVDMGTHSHEITANGDGTVTIGGPTATGGSFNIADTQFYKDGVSAAKASVDFESFTDVQYHSDTKAYTFKISLDNGKDHAYSHNALDAYNAGANSVYIEKIEWGNPAKGYVQCNITLSNGVQRGPSYQVPAGWM